MRNKTQMSRAQSRSNSGTPAIERRETGEGGSAWFAVTGNRHVTADDAGSGSWVWTREVAGAAETGGVSGKG
jgi:hypothetical protein